jgi:hypothetical protein
MSYVCHRHRAANCTLGDKSMTATTKKKTMKPAASTDAALIAARLAIRKMKGLGFAAARPLLRPAEELGDDLPDAVFDRVYLRGYDCLVSSPIKTPADAAAAIRYFSEKSNRNDGERERLTARAVKVLERHVAA